MIARDGEGRGGIKLQLSSLSRKGYSGEASGALQNSICAGVGQTATAKAQSKATDLQITRSAMQGFSLTNTSRSALSLAKRQVGQQLWETPKTHVLYVALVSSLHYLHRSKLSVWSSPGSGKSGGRAELESPFVRVETPSSEKESQSRGLFQDETQTRRKRGEKRTRGGKKKMKAQTGFRPKRNKDKTQTNTNQKTTTTKKNLQHNKNTIQPSTAKVQLSTLNYITVIDWTADRAKEGERVQ